MLEVLEETGLAESTRIIYTSDHGESMGRRGLWGKFTLYEESAAVPLILAGPGVPAGQVSDDPVSLVDCHPTILEAVGVDPDELMVNCPVYRCGRSPTVNRWDVRRSASTTRWG